MGITKWLPMFSLLLLTALAGCGEDRPPEARLLPPVDDAVIIVLEAEGGTFEPAMTVEDFAECTHPEAGLQEASGGRCIAVPKDANKADKDNPKGRLVLKFTVPKDGTYYVHPRVWWKDGCGNTLGMAVDNSAPLLVTDSTYEVWHWVKLNPDDFKSTAPRPFKLKKGAHTITFSNREDDVKLDQVYITNDPDDRPAGVMRTPE
ncbi:MAG: hypothetical protein ABIF82_01020 [Planctomycetota bacterium]